MSPMTNKASGGISERRLVWWLFICRGLRPAAVHIATSSPRRQTEDLRLLALFGAKLIKSSRAGVKYITNDGQGQWLDNRRLAISNGRTDPLDSTHQSTCHTDRLLGLTETQRLIGQNTQKLLYIIYNKLLRPAGPPYSLIDSDTPATLRCCKACAININAQALRCCSQPASRLL